MDTPQDLTAVESLLADREALRGWIDRLNGTDSVVPDAVRARVRADYEIRLHAVTDQLRAHADTISGKLADDREEHGELLAQATSARDALAEAELRYAVGEYDQVRYDSERTSHASDVETYDLALGAVAERIARLEDVHRLVSVHPDDAVPPEPVHAPVFHEHLDGARATPVTPVSGSELTDEPPAIGIGIGELALGDTESLLAIFDDADDDAESVDEPEATAHDDVVSSAAPSSEPGPLSFRPSAPALSERDTPRPSSGRYAPLETQNIGGRGVDVVIDQDTADAPAERGAPVSRTTRCGECGAMNLPMEWYCEKCGAELTTI